VVPGAGILADGVSTRVDPTVVALKKAFDVGDGSSTTITVTHNLGTYDVVVGLYNKSTFEEVDTDITHATVNTVTLTFASAPASASFRCVIHG